MSERCPLTGLAFDDDIPEVCRVQCEPLWREAVRTGEPEIDEFENYDEDLRCGHPAAEFFGDSLQGEGAARFYSINHVCTSCRTELDSETYTFTCPHA